MQSIGIKHKNKLIEITFNVLYYHKGTIEPDNETTLDVDILSVGDIDLRSDFFMRHPTLKERLVEWAEGQIP